MENKDSEGAIIQNLKDAGCDSDTISVFMEELRSGRIDEGLEILSVYRRSLLDALHKGQKQIDCLDYLVYIMQKRIKA